MSITAPPWKLNGKGAILYYSFSKKFLLDNGFIPAHLHSQFKGGLATVMMVTYKDSDVGPYNELLFIPGIFNINGKFRLMITKAYVDSEDSLVSGRYNWGIPKEMAEISWAENNGKIKFNSTKDGNMILFSEFKPRGFAIPVTSGMYPFNIHQNLEGKNFLFKPKAKGKATFMKIDKVVSDQKLFPDLSNGKLISSSFIKSFNMTFPDSVI